MIDGLRRASHIVIVPPASNLLIIGDFTYHTKDSIIDLEKLFRDPSLWIGNKSLIEFTGEIIFRLISFEPYHSISLFLNKIPFNKMSNSAKEKIFNDNE